MMKRFLRKVFVCLVLVSLAGSAMPPEQIEELMSTLNQQKVEMTIPAGEGDDEPIKKLLKFM